MAIEKFISDNCEVIEVNGKVINLILEATGEAHITWEQKEKISIYADYSEPHELEYESEVISYNFTPVDDNGDPISLTSEEIEACDKKAYSWAEDMVSSYEDWDF